MTLLKRFFSTAAESILAKPSVPEIFPQVLVVPISHRPFFPNTYKEITVTEPAVCDAIQKLESIGQPYIGNFLLKNEDEERDLVTDLDQIYPIGVFSQIMRTNRNKDNSLSCTVLTHRRIKIQDLLTPSVLEKPFEELKEQDGPKLYNFELYKELGVTSALVQNLYCNPYDAKEPRLKAMSSAILSVIKEIMKLSNTTRENMTSFNFSGRHNLIGQPEKLIDFSASMMPLADPKELQGILELTDIATRLEKTLVLLKKELNHTKLQNQIDKEVEERMSQTRKEYFLLEHMKGIQKELGVESDGKDKLIQQFLEKAKSLKMPDSVKEAFDEEMNKFKNLDPSAMDYNVSRNYLDWLTQLPWGKTTEENFDLERAKNILDRDHYGMKEVKERILEFIAVGKMKNSVQGKILCLVGAPGVGKTSIGKSIASALNREFYRFSVGGLNDVSELKGHRRTYVGSMPGKFCQALKKLQTENPLILLDEIDKIGRSNFRGDPSSALLEVLDPEQNSTFLDHYMDVPIDLSKTLFMCTANVLDTIPGPLLDRMEIIELSGYVAEEKMSIAEKYLIPHSREQSGLKPEQIHLEKEALKLLIKDYCRESGVRQLKKQIEKIFRKAALKTIEASNDQPIKVTSQNLSEFVGKAVFGSDLLYEPNDVPAGVVMGLAWTGMGGDSLFMESLIEDSKVKRPHMKQTGQLGDVMKESTNIAYSYAKAYLAQHQPENHCFQENSIHLHVPHGAIKKDGPSAGITLCTSLLSLALQQPVPNVAMTGELTLTGKILKIGGVKEKLIAAKRSGVKLVLFPEANRSDYEQLEEFIKDGVQVQFVDWYDDVARILFPSLFQK